MRADDARAVPWGFGRPPGVDTCAGAIGDGGTAGRAQRGAHSQSSQAPGEKKVAHKGAKATHAKAATAGYDAGGARPDAQPILHAPSGAPADPLSFGMKWNGANDDARGTRVQNYGGDAQGTGAEVGMKLHF